MKQSAENGVLCLSLLTDLEPAVTLGSILHYFATESVAVDTRKDERLMAKQSHLVYHCCGSLLFKLKEEKECR